jgi:hypothetical protein
MLWHWYTNEDRRFPLFKEVVGIGGGPDLIWASQEPHKFHCTYMWRTLHGEIEHKTSIYNHLASCSYTIYCSSVLVVHARTQFYTIYAWCPVLVY